MATVGLSTSHHLRMRFENPTGGQEQQEAAVFQDGMHLEDVYTTLGNLVPQGEVIKDESGTPYTGYQLAELVEAAMKEALTWSEDRSRVSVGEYDGNEEGAKQAVLSLDAVNRLPATSNLRTSVAGAVVQKLQELGKI